MNISDRRHLDAAQGWIGLGLHAEAENELWQIAPAYRQHPEFLETRCQIFAHDKRWVECLQTAKAILDRDPESAMGHIQLAYALEHLEGTRVAYETLRPAADKITDSITIFYNMACYACELGRVDEARKWLAKTFEMSESDDCEWGLFYRNMAKEDLQLRPLWNEISGIGRSNLIDFLV